MDPVTAIGLLSSLASLIEASNSLLKLAKSFRHGEREIVELFNDVAIFGEALEGFDRVLRSRRAKHNISATVIDRAFEEASATIQELESRLVQMSKSDVSAVRRMKWVQHKSNLKKLHERLKEQSTMLQSFLALAHAFVASLQKRAMSLLTTCAVKHSSLLATSILSFFKSGRFRQMKLTTMRSLLRNLLRQRLQRSHVGVRRLRFDDHLWTLCLRL